MSDDQRAKDWIRTQRGWRNVVGESTTSRVNDRAHWRPAGNSRGFWKKIEAEDPFVEREPATPKRRVVYAAGRFVRLGEPEPAPTSKKEDPGWKPPPKPRRVASEPPSERSPVNPLPVGPDQVHTPDRGKRAVAPTPAIPVPGEAEQSQEPAEGRVASKTPTRTPKKRVQGGPVVSRAGRLRTTASPVRAGGRKLVQGGTPPEANPARPPKKRELGKDGDPHPLHENRRSRSDLFNMLGKLREAEETDRMVAEAKAKGDDIPDYLVDAQERLKREASGRRFQPPKPPAQKQPPPPVAAPEVGLSEERKSQLLGKAGADPKPAPPRRSRDSIMQALAQLQASEARDRQIAETKARGETWVPDEQLFGETEAWSPPPKPKRVADAPSAPPVAPVATSQPKPKAPVSKAAAPPPGGIKLPVRPADDDPRRAAVRNPKRALAAEPEPEAAGGSTPSQAPPAAGLDDLFGGASEGRVRIGRRKKPPSSEG